MNIKFNFSILDCLLHGKFSRAGDLGTHLLIKESLCETTRVSLMDCLRCDMPRCLKGSKLFFEGKTPIHVESALKATRAIIDCMSDSDEKLFLRFSMKSLFSIYNSLISIPYEFFIKTMKYFTTYPLAFFLGNQLPPKPDNLVKGQKYPFPGNSAIRSWLKVRLFSKSHYTRNLKLFWSLLQGVKRACEFADSSFITETMLKHKSVLSQIDTTCNLGFIRRYNYLCPKTERCSELQEITDLSEIQRIEFVSEQVEYFRKQNLKFFKNFSPVLDKEYEISNSACWERKRSEGGQRGLVLDLTNDVYCDVYRSVVSSSLSDVLHLMIETRPGFVEELRGVRTPRWEELNHNICESREDFEDFFSIPHAMVAAILEPLKVRLITKGPGIDYFLSKSFQKELFRYLRTFPQFELIGDPLREDHLYRMMERETEIGLDKIFSYFVSGDYSNATDNLKGLYTKLGLEASMSGFCSPLKDAYRNTLYEHEIHYPTAHAITNFSQSSGQLMGSPLSFPFLCLNNLLAYKLSLEEYTGRTFNFKELPCLINGDDILFRTNREHYLIWKRIVTSIGFDLSIGKNYVHEKVLTINSTCFLYKNETFSKVEFCNFGLLSGTSKLGGSRGEVRDKACDLRDAYTRSVGGATNKSLAFARFLSRNREDIQRVTCRGRYNLFLPLAVGGLGLTPYTSIHYHVTRFQACLAKLIKKTLNFTIVGFKSDGMSNSVGMRESNNKKKILLGLGPLNQYERPYEEKNFTSCNSSYLQDTVTKFFTTIREKYNSKELFPFTLKSKDLEFDRNVDSFRIIQDYSF